MARHAVVCTTGFMALAKRHDEFLRLVTALQTPNANGVATPGSFGNDPNPGAGSAIFMGIGI